MNLVSNSDGYPYFVVTGQDEFVNFVFSTDYHLSAIPLGRRAATYTEEILGKIRFAGDTAVRLKAFSLCGGDVFHFKSPSHEGNTFELVNTLIEDIQRHHPNGKLYGTHGNHDIFADRTCSIENQPFGTLTRAGVFHDFSGGFVIFTNRDGSIEVQVDAFPYADDMVTLERALTAPPRQDGVDYRVLIMHQYGNPGAQGSMHGHPTIGYDQMKDCDYDVVLWGHDHSRAETQRVGNPLHIRLGSLSRASLAKDEADRPVSLAYLSFRPDAVKFKEISVPVKPLELAFAAADKPVEKVKKSEEVVAWINEMTNTMTTVNQSEPRPVVQELCGDDTALYSLICEKCSL